MILPWVLRERNGNVCRAALWPTTNVPAVMTQSLYTVGMSGVFDDCFEMASRAEEPRFCIQLPESPGYLQRDPLYGENYKRISNEPTKKEGTGSVCRTAIKTGMAKATKSVLLLLS